MVGLGDHGSRSDYLHRCRDSSGRLQEEPTHLGNSNNDRRAGWFFDHRHHRSCISQYRRYGDHHVQFNDAIRCSNDSCECSSSSRDTSTGRENLIPHDREIFPRNNHFERWAHNNHRDDHYRYDWSDEHFHCASIVDHFNRTEFNDLNIHLIAVYDHNHIFSHFHDRHDDNRSAIDHVNDGRDHNNHNNHNKHNKHNKHKRAYDDNKQLVVTRGLGHGPHWFDCLFDLKFPACFQRSMAGDLFGALRGGALSRHWPAPWTTER